MPPAIKNNVQLVAIIITWAVMICGGVWFLAVADAHIQSNTAAVRENREAIRDSDMRANEIERQLASIDAHLEHIRASIDKLTQ